MAFKYFKKGAVGTNLRLPTGAYVRFTKIDLNTEVFGTDDEVMQGELDKLVGKRAGLEEITFEEYDSLKKNKDSRPPWREELRNDDLKRGIAQGKPNLFDRGGPLANPAVDADNFEAMNRAAIGAGPLINPIGSQQAVPLARPKASSKAS